MNRRRLWIVLGASAALIVVAAVSIWWFLLRSDAPEAVSLEGALASVASSTTSTPPPETTAPSPASTLAADPPQTTTTIGDDPPPIEGAWTLAGDGRSFAGYRVREELAGIGFFEAVGRSSEVSGSLTIEGGQVTAVDVLVDMTALRSDDSRRDGAIRRQALETDTFPEASFSLTEPITLPAGAAAGDAFAVEGVGELELHGVTRTVTLPLEAQLAEGSVVVVGSLPILFADYGITPPSAAIVLSVEDNGVMEFQLVFVR